MNHSEVLPKLIEICVSAGDAIMEIYNTDFEIDTKSDDSPVTTADLAAHTVIKDALSQLTPNIPQLSEESADIPYDTRKTWNSYWLIDPLDGTKEFIKKNGEFTVNIALIENHEPVMGVVHVPAKNITYYASRDAGAYKRDADGTNHFLQARKETPTAPVVVASRSHRGAELEAYLQKLGEHEVTSMGSSLKLCLVAEGEADLYPRIGLTSEWDTGAAQAIVEIAGGEVVKLDRSPLRYNTKNEYLNPYFLVFGNADHDWCAYAE